MVLSGISKHFCDKVILMKVKLFDDVLNLDFVDFVEHFLNYSVIFFVCGLDNLLADLLELTLKFILFLCHFVHKVKLLIL